MTKMTRTLLLTALLTSTALHAAPTVSLTAPTANAVYIGPATVVLSANATPSAGTTVTKVQFYRGTTLIASDTTAPYSITWSNAAAGSYNLTAKATDNQGGVTTSAIVPIFIDKIPSISWSAPASGATFPSTVPTIALTATASDTDGTISKVEFYNGSTLIGTVTNSPYTLNWPNPGPGSYSLTAKATDNHGGTKSTAARSISVNNPPSVSLTGPTNNQNFPTGSTITLTATASDTDGTISKVQFYRGTTLIASDTTNPYSATWSNAAQGTYQLTAKATDNKSGVTTSTPVSITVGTPSNTPPTISLTTPSNGQLYTVPADVTLNATASDSDGTITKVEFYEGANLLASKTAAPFTHTWANVPQGSYSLTAKATDDKGATTTTTPKTITVQANQAPTITLNTPTNNQSVEAGTQISFTATVNDPENQIARVDYLANGQVVATSYSSPYSANWTPNTPGTIQITATVTDNVGQSAQTTPISLTVTSPQPKIRYVHTDHLGTPRTITDQNNTTIWRHLPTTEPFGTAAPEEDPDNDGTPYTFNLRFPGQYHDKETNLSYNYFRDYDPATGRYVQSDPIGLQGGVNTYAYVDGNPLSRTDPKGLFWGLLFRLLGFGLTANSIANDPVPIVGSGFAGAACKVTNPVPSTLVRVIPANVPAKTLGSPGSADVFVTAAEDIAGMSAAQIAGRLTIPESAAGFKLIEFPTPQSGIASPVFRENPGFCGCGQTAGGAREFVIPNQPIPSDATIRVVK